MLHGEALGLLLGAVALGAVHGMEPGHGWPVAATYALDQRNKWLSGFAASFILGVGHLVSSIAMVGVFFYAKSYFSLTQVNEPMTVFGLTVGGPVSVVAGVLLILLGLREYYGGHSHGHGGDDGHGHSHQADRGHAHPHDDGDSHAHGHDGHSHHHDGEDGHGYDHDEASQPHDGDGHSHDHAHEEGENTHDHGHGHSHEHDEHHGHAESDPTLWDRIRGFVPFAGGHSHDHGDLDEAAERGLFGIAWFAFLLGFAHEEEFEIIALCAGSTHCLELMSAYALTVIVGIVTLTMLLVAGYEHYEERVERYTPYLPAFSAAVLILMGLGFVTGLF